MNTEDEEALHDWWNKDRANSTMTDIEFETWEAALEYERAKTRWVPVGERLPDDCKEVILFSESGVAAGCHDTGYGWSTSSEWLDVSFDNITHWMPLPEPPKE